MGLQRVLRSRAGATLREPRVDVEDRGVERERHGAFLIGDRFYHAMDGAPPLAHPPPRRSRSSRWLLGRWRRATARRCAARHRRRPGPAARNATTAALLPTHVAELPTFDVQTYQRLLTQLRGTPVVVNVWAAWCGPCRDEAPLLHAGEQTYGDRVQFLGVDIIDSLDGARGFIDEHGLTYPSVFDPSGDIRDSLGMIRAAGDGVLRRRRGRGRHVQGQLTPHRPRRGDRRGARLSRLWQAAAGRPRLWACGPAGAATPTTRTTRGSATRADRRCRPSRSWRHASS